VRICGTKTKMKLPTPQVDRGISIAGIGQEMDKTSVWLDSVLAGGSAQRYSDVMNQLGRGGEVDAAVMLVGHMIRSGAALHRTTFNNLLAACAKSGNCQVAEFWMHKMIDLQKAPNRSSYCHVILACVKGGDLRQSEEWVVKMLAAGFPPPKDFSRSLVRAWTNGRSSRQERISPQDLDSLASWLLRINQFGVELNRSTMNHMMAAYARIGNIGETERWANVMIQVGIQPNCSTLQALVTACTVAGVHGRADYWLGQMEELGFEPGLLTLQQCSQRIGDEASNVDDVNEDFICSLLVAGVNQVPTVVHTAPPGLPPPTQAAPPGFDSSPQPFAAAAPLVKQPAAPLGGVDFCAVAAQAADTKTPLKSLVRSFGLPTVSAGEELVLG